MANRYKVTGKMASYSKSIAKSIEQTPSLNQKYPKKLQW